MSHREVVACPGTRDRVPEVVLVRGCVVQRLPGHLGRAGDQELLELWSPLRPVGEDRRDRDVASPFHLGIRPRVARNALEPTVDDVVTDADQMREHIAGAPARARGRGNVERGGIEVADQRGRPERGVRPRRSRVAQSSGAPFSRRDRAPDNAASTSAQPAPTSKSAVEFDFANGPATSTPSGTVPPKSHDPQRHHPAPLFVAQLLSAGSSRGT